mmetsp:Transcript_87042/g.280987  ORF Transcript_87042/g.280987 Transcript_87042/m.280987 type:complete len:285 (+) Transcript_87042:561-1415(+)
MMASFSARSLFDFSLSSFSYCLTALYSSTSLLLIICSLLRACCSRFRASCCARWFSMAATSAAERSCIFRRCRAASFSRPMPRSCSSFSWMSLRIAWASFCFIRTSSCAIALFLFSSFVLCCAAFAICCCLMMSNLAIRASRSSSAFCKRCEALSCSSWRFANSSAMKRFRAPSLFTSCLSNFSSSCVSNSWRSRARVMASTLPEPAPAGCTPCFFGATISSSSSSSSPGSTSFSSTSGSKTIRFVPMTSGMNCSRSITHSKRPSCFLGFRSFPLNRKRWSKSL